MKINSFVQRLASAALRVAPMALIVGFFGVTGNVYASTTNTFSTSCGPTDAPGKTIFESSGYTPAGCLFTAPAASDKQWCSSQNLTIFLPANSGTCLICVQAKYAALVANDTLNQEANPKGYIYLPTYFSETALTLDPYGISYFDGVHTPFRCLKCTQPPSGLTAWWTLDQWAGHPVVDAKQNMPDGNPVGTTIVTGQSGNAAYFNGSAYIEVPSTPNDSAHVDVGTGDFSIDAWVKIDAGTNLSGVQVMLEKRTGSNPFTQIYRGYSFFLYNGYLGLQLANGTAGNYLAPSLVVPPDGHWHFVAVSVARDPSNPNPAIQFTLDGTPVQDSHVPPGGSLSNTSNLRIGMDTIGQGSGFLGSIDEVEFFNRALAPNEFQAIYNAKCYGKCK